jgi:serine protease
VCAAIVPTAGCEVLNELLALLCDQESDPECEDPERGHITGTISVPAAGAAAASAGMTPASPLIAEAIELMNAEARAQRPLRPAPRVQGLVPTKRYRVPEASVANQGPDKLLSQERWREGEVIVRGRDAVRGAEDAWQALLAQALDDGQEVRIDLCNTDFMCLARVYDERGEPLDEMATAAVANRLHRLDEVRYAEVNRVLQITRTPNDDLYPIQWHYSAMRLPAAWDITTGHPDVVAAVIDTGIVEGHPDLDDVVVGGADLIEDATGAGDGDGRDTDWNDVGDNACGNGCHSFHGTHVAGTMGAETDNAQMVAGVAWEGQLLAVRVLGAGGGSLFDIAGGIYWSLGSDVDGVPNNDNPADVINMSLGGRGESEAMDEAVQDAVDFGTIVIVAAGNDNADAAEYTPANAPGAITVAALGNIGGDREVPTRATYSNYGSVVDVAAPGGEQAEDIDNDGQPDGVLSTIDADGVTFYQGTSMASPHVAGVAMLMKALDPDLTQAQTRTLLTDTADDNIDCNDCGAGLVSAVRVLREMEGITGEALVVANNAVIRIGRGDLDAEVEFENVGEVGTDVTLSVGGPDREKISLDVTSDTLAANEKLRVRVGIDRTGDDRGEATLTATTTAGQAAEAQLIWTEEVVNVSTTVQVGALRIDGDSIIPERIVSASQIDGYAYKLFNLTPGDYLVIGLSDDDNDGEFELQEGVGVFPRIQEPQLVSVAASETVTDGDFLVAPAFDYEEGEETGDGPVGAACTTSADCAGGLYCEPSLPAGYCTKDCSGGSDCPDGSSCWCLGSDGADGCAYRICLQDCVAAGDCRGDDGYVCDVDMTCYTP